MIRILRLLFFFGLVLIVAMAILTSVHVVGRYAFNRPVFGQVELACLMQVIAISMAGAYTLSQRRHITIGLVVDRLPERIQAAIDFATHLLCLVFFSLAAWQSVKQATFLLQVGQHTEILRVSVAPFFYVLGVGWGLLSVVAIILLIRFASTVAKR